MGSTAGPPHTPYLHCNTGGQVKKTNKQKNTDARGVCFPSVLEGTHSFPGLTGISVLWPQEHAHAYTEVHLQINLTRTSTL